MMAVSDEDEIARARRLKAWLQKHRGDLSLRQIAKNSGIPNSVLGAYVNEDRPITERVVKKLVAKLGISKEYLMRGSNIPEQSAGTIASRSIPLISWSDLGDSKMALRQASKKAKSHISVPPSDDLSQFAVALPVGSNCLMPMFSAETIMIMDEKAEWEPGKLVFAFVYERSKFVYGKAARKGYDESGNAIVDIEPINTNYETTRIVEGVTGEILARVKGAYTRL